MRLPDAFFVIGFSPIFWFRLFPNLTRSFSKQHFNRVGDFRAA